MEMLKAYAHWRLPGGATLLSEHVDLESWSTSIGTARKHGATHVLLHAGFSRLTDDDVYRWFDGQGDTGIFFTEAAMAVSPQDWLSPGLEVDAVGSVRVLQMYEATHAVAATINMDRNPLPELPEMVSPDAPTDLESEQEAETVEPTGSAVRSLAEFMQDLWGALDASELEILRGRWGCDGAKLTLDDLGKRRDVSRERIRQIEAKTLRQLLQQPMVHAFAERLQHIERTCALPVPLQDLPKVDPWFGVASLDEPYFRSALVALTNGRFDLVIVKDIPYLVPFSRQQWDAWGQSARETLKGLAERRLVISDVDEILGQSLAKMPKKYLPLLRLSNESNMRIAIMVNGHSHFVAFGSGVKECIQLVLSEAEEPLHRSEVVRRIKSLSVGDQTDMSISNALPLVGLLLGSGSYGLRQHIPLTDEEIRELVAVAEEVVLSGNADRQWTTTELVREVAPLVSFANDAIGKYVVGACLRLGPTQLSDVGRGVWSSSGQAGANNRIFIRERIIEILQEAGRTLSTEELKGRLRAERGLDDTFQIQPRDPLFRAGVAQWGLLDRDLAIPVGEVAPYLDQLKAHLLRAGSGIHVSEANSLLEQAGMVVDWISDPEVLLALARRRGDMRVTQSRYLVLPGWKDERRVMPKQAILDAVKENPKRRAEDLAVSAARRCGRAVSTDMVRTILNENDAVFDRENGIWRLDSASLEMAP
jgi:hypothetical protein